MLEKATLLATPVVLALALGGCDAQANKAKSDKASKGDGATAKEDDATVEADASNSTGGSKVVVDPNGNLQIGGASIGGQ